MNSARERARSHLERFAGHASTQSRNRWKTEESNFSSAFSSRLLLADEQSRKHQSTGLSDRERIASHRVCVPEQGRIMARTAKDERPAQTSYYGELDAIRDSRIASRKSGVAREHIRLRPTRSPIGRGDARTYIVM